MSRFPLRIGDEAPDFHVGDASGERVHLRSLCQSGPVVLLFLRSPALFGVDSARRVTFGHIGSDMAERPDWEQIFAALSGE